MEFLASPIEFKEVLLNISHTVSAVVLGWAGCRLRVQGNALLWFVLLADLQPLGAVVEHF